MTFIDVMKTEYWGFPLWGWIAIVAGIGLIITIAKVVLGKKKEGDDEAKKTEGDVEAGNIKLGEPAKSSSPATTAAANDYARDAPLPPPAPSETSHKG